MNRRQFLSASIMTSITALLFSRRNTAADTTEPPPPQAEGWCLEYIPPTPSGTAENSTVYIPIATNDD
ncbi:MAG: hypothetical protein KDD89_09560 [Anaerolineales bacterium]|nr:hypothetical protein [Anaerolineales bacterium]